MSVPKLRLTDAGGQIIARALAGETLWFTKLALGDGQLTSEGQIVGLTGLIHHVMDVPITSRRRKEGQVTLSGKLTPPTSEFRWRELGVFAKAGETGTERLYGYINLYEDGEIIKPSDGADRSIYVTVAVGNVQNVEVVLAPIEEATVSIHIVRCRERDPSKPDYGLGGGGDDGGDETPVLRVKGYTGTAEVSAVVSGVEYDAENLSVDGENVPDGTLIIKTKTLEE